MSKSRQDGSMPVVECTSKVSRSSRGRQSDCLGSSQPRHRSESRKIHDERRPAKAVARTSAFCPVALDEADAVRVFSKSANRWVDGHVVKFLEGNFVRVEYGIGEDWCGKTLHLHSEHLDVLTAVQASPRQCSSTSFAEGEQDPECWNLVDMASKGMAGDFADIRQFRQDPLAFMAGGYDLGEHLSSTVDLVEYSPRTLNLRNAVDRCLSQVHGGAKLVCLGRQRFQRPSNVALGLCIDSVLLETDTATDMFEAIFMPSTLVERKASMITLKATHGTTWGLVLEFDSEKQASRAEEQFLEIAFRVVGSLHSTFPSGGKAYPTLSLSRGRPTFLPTRGKDLEARWGTFILGGYVVIGHVKNENHPIMPATAAPVPPCFRVVWGELRGPNAHGRMRLVSFAGCESNLDEYLDEEELSFREGDMTLQNNNVVIYGCAPPGYIRCPAEVPYDTYISFRSSLEAQLWYAAARDPATSKERLLDNVRAEMRSYSTLQKPLLIRTDKSVALKAGRFPMDDVAVKVRANQDVENEETAKHFRDDDDDDEYSDGSREFVPNGTTEWLH